MLLTSRIERERDVGQALFWGLSAEKSQSYQRDTADVIAT